MSQLLISIQNAQVIFGRQVLFEDLSFNIHRGDKICLIGKNGSGKSTLMNIIVGTQDLDGGKRIELPQLSIGYLTQEAKFLPEQTVYDYLFTGLKKENQSDDYAYMVDMIAHPLQINTEDLMKNLSGGQLRRAALAHSLIENPDLLLLDEPTNHLDFESVKWLENYLMSYAGTLVCISHDRAFLKNISDKVFWLDRGKIKVCPKGYSYFEEWSEMLLEQERRELENREKIIELEEEWAGRGVKARRKRNMKRLHDVREEREKLKSDQSLFRQTMQKLDLEPIHPSMSSKIVVEFIKVGKYFKDEIGNKKVILDQFNLRVIKGDKIGILGNNGSGKTSFLKMILGDLIPDSGKVKLSRNIKISYFDQKRSTLDFTESLRKNLCPSGGDYIDVMGKTRHVCGYLKDFMFDPKSADDPIHTLSGGQKNRLMLAKVLANPGNCLILDEPTNDLDMDTLDMLEEILANYKGTLFVVSHDRDFLDKTVNKIIAFEGEGEVTGHIGGYSDYERETRNKEIELKEKNAKNDNKKIENKEKNKIKVSYKIQYELDNLPKIIDELNVELKKLNEKFSNPNFFSDSNSTRDKDLSRSKEIIHEIERLEHRWLELEELVTA